MYNNEVVRPGLPSDYNGFNLHHHHHRFFISFFSVVHEKETKDKINPRRILERIHLFLLLRFLRCGTVTESSSIIGQQNKFTKDPQLRGRFELLN